MAGAGPSRNAELKSRLLRVAATTDRGQLLFKEPVYGLQAYSQRREAEAMSLIAELRGASGDVGDVDPKRHSGCWELVFATKQLFRASPFFMAISESMKDSTWHAPWSDPSTAVASNELFFRLHELQVMSWGASTVGRVTQKIDVDALELSSTFDTILFRLTVIPIVGWFKLLPTFGGRVMSFARNLEMEEEEDGSVRMTFELEKTRVEKADGIPTPPFFLRPLLNIDFPVNGGTYDLWIHCTPEWCRHLISRFSRI